MTTTTRKTIRVENIQPRPYKGKLSHTQRVEKNIYNAEIVPGKSIRIYGSIRGTESTGFREVYLWGFRDGDRDGAETARLLALPDVESEELAGMVAAWQAAHLISDEEARIRVCGIHQAVIQDWLEEHEFRRNLPLKQMTVRSRFVETWTPFNRTFHVGDEVITGSYNLTYLDPISAISAKTVTTTGGTTGYPETKRFDLYTFIDRNHDLDLAKVRKHNSEWTD